MQFKDYYATLGLERSATQAEIKRAYRKLARKFHPDVSKEPDAEARFKDVAEAYKALHDPERRAAYDDVSRRHERGQSFDPPPGWDTGYEFSGRGDGAGAAPDFSDFFESLFGRARANARSEARGQARGEDSRPAVGGDHHAKVVIDLTDSYRGTQRTITLHVPVVDDKGRRVLQERELQVNIPKGVRAGQHMRLAGQGAPGRSGQPAGDLYLEIIFRPSPPFRVDGRDVYVDLPIAPWEAALGATVTAQTPDGSVQLTIPSGSPQGRKLRLKGKGLPGSDPGDLYAVLGIALPPSDTTAAKDAYTAMARAFPDYDPRSTLEA